MTAANDLKTLASRINWNEFIQTFRAEGWQEYPTKRKNIVRIFQKEVDGEFLQAIVPIDRTLADFDRVILEAVETYARAHGITVERAIMELTNTVSDRISFRLVASKNVRASISIDDGAALYGGIKSLIHSAAQVAVEQTPRGNRGVRLDQFLRSCQFSQTEIGSYVVSAILPFERALPDDSDYLVTPLARLTSIEIMDRASEFLQAAAEDHAEGILTAKATEMKRHGVEFLKSLRSLCRLSDSQITVSGRWSSRAPQFPKKSSFCLSHDSFDVFDSAVRMAENQVAVRENPVCAGVGKIDRLEAEPNIDERQGGFARVRAILSGKTSKSVNFRLRLSPDDYRIALQAHESGRIVQFTGNYSEDGKNVDCKRLLLLDLGNEGSDD